MYGCMLHLLAILLGFFLCMPSHLAFTYRVARQQLARVRHMKAHPLNCTDIRIVSLILVDWRESRCSDQHASEEPPSFLLIVWL